MDSVIGLQSKNQAETLHALCKLLYKQKAERPTNIYQECTTALAVGHR